MAGIEKMMENNSLFRLADVAKPVIHHGEEPMPKQLDMAEQSLADLQVQGSSVPINPLQEKIPAKPELAEYHRIKQQNMQKFREDTPQETIQAPAIKGQEKHEKLVMKPGHQ